VSSAYRVLARKYRPQTFGELIGQDAMVQTLGNAIRRGRLAHAFLMTGVRGVGKTSTARLIAKALNCIGPDGQGGPTIDPCGQCEPCKAIAEGRHIDVIEMDAASHTGVDDVREIIEAVRYAAVSARYKVYIIDEVHMLSQERLQRAVEDAGRAAGACEVPVRHHRGQQGAGDGAFALPALRPAADFGGEARRAFRPCRGARRRGGGRGGAGADRAGGGRLRARWPLDPRSGDRPCRAQSVEEREAFAEWASQLGFAPLHRLWQLLLKGHDEVVRAAMPAEAADMALLRLIHAASLPDPSDLARLLEGGAQIASAAPPASSAAAPSPAPPAAAMPSSFEALVQALWDRNKGLIADEIEHFVRPIRYAPPELDFEPAKPMAQDQIDRIRLAIEEVTRGRWQMRAMSGDAQPTIIERREHAEQQARDALLGLPVMQAAMQAFPDAELLGADDTAKWSESA
jgi:hypothetical protein